ncbi:PREDICTED: fatty acyl-CoA reductase 1-like isoform X1 [Papilio xuthus]|uniref:Fatty acyl-CoA reductase n=1 Tax=Papilio xuthus TaxID=66420 RepID=A0AAJ6ZP63_PAPXU|nr:PREDICTED: fatty acyl-CoA reductase 1-like isoform X1 [Papilio xuthus]
MEYFDNVADFYAGKSIFITGGTGFLGKVLIEKLLYSCPKLDKIYLLIRGKKNDTPESRLRSIFEQPIFKRLKEERLEDLRKIIPIIGDITEENLGIQKNDENIIVEKVAIVIHAAATLRFVEPLQIAMNVNFEGTKRVLDLCKKIKQLETFVYISTAYTNVNRQVIEEIVYPPPASYKHVYDIIEKYGDDTAQTKKLLGDLPNTYVFTKALAENYVAENHGNIPTIIIRPSIVTGSKNEPIEGWIDNWAGATALITMIALGFLRVLFGKFSNVIDLIPVDFVSNLTIVAAAKCNRSKELRVYNCSSSGTNPLPLGILCKTFIKEAVQHKINAVPYPTITFTKSYFIAKIIIFLTSILPAFVLDCFLQLTGKEARYLRKQRKIINLFYVLQYFSSHSWLIQSTKTQSLYASLPNSDKEKFPCISSSIVWSEYLPVYFNGIKTYLL